MLDELRRRGRLAGGGGGSDDGGMLEQRVSVVEATLIRIEKRLDSLEAKFDRFDDRLRKLEIDMAEIRGRTASMPTTWTLVTTGFGMVLSTCGMMFAILRFGIPH